jgi:hypothetical protein
VISPPNAKYLIRQFNISTREWITTFKYQERCCGICSKRIVKKGDAKTDHVHGGKQAGLFRGILCFRCNAALREYTDARFLKRALKYVKYPPALEALGRAAIGLPGRVGTKKQRKLARKLKKESK